MSSQSTSDTVRPLDPADVKISLHGIICEGMDEDKLRSEAEFKRHGVAWSMCVSFAHETILRQIRSGDIPESVCDCAAFDSDELTCFTCFKHGIEEVS